MKIEDVVLYRVTGGEGDSPETFKGVSHSDQLDLYPDIAENKDNLSERPARPVPSALYVEVQSEKGLSGLFGPIQESQAYVIQRFLRPILIGEDALATEALLDKMMRLHRHGRSGMFMTGVSPIDCALWDLKGKHFDLPVYRLLGGPTRSEVPAYASMSGFPIEPEEAARVARKFKDEGFIAQKWFMPYGPAHGEQGMRKNKDLAFALREALGEHYQIMFDAFMGWDLTYACEMARVLQPIRPRWLEEPVPPERIGVFKEIKKAAGFPIATGEHVYTRWQVKELLEAGAIDVLQTDPDWTGGITELTKINALASSFEVPVIAHGHSLLAALHVAAAQSPASVPLIEFLIRTQPQKQFFHKPLYWPEKGSLRLPELPGLGLVLDPEKTTKKERVSFELIGEPI